MPPGDPAHLRVATFPRSLGGNPYQDLFEAALARRGVEQVTVPPRLSRRWAHSAAGRVDAVHLHWLEFLYQRPTIRGLRRPASVVTGQTAVASLRRLAASPVPVVWTLHNLWPHEPNLVGTFERVRAAATRAADVVLCHSDEAAARARVELGRPDGVWTVRHGNYLGAYPSPRRARAEVRRDLRVPDGAFLYLAFGQVRAYKRTPEAIRAFRGLPDPDARLLIAGQARDPDLRREVREAARADDRVLLRLEVIADDEVAELHLAADAALLNHRELFSSGALLLALSHGLPVVAPRSGTVLETAPGAASEVFDDGGLVGALKAVRHGDPAARRAAAFAAARACDSDEAARLVVAAYRGQRAQEGAPGVTSVSSSSSHAES